jgi:hypothetical protein
MEELDDMWQLWQLDRLAALWHGLAFSVATTLYPQYHVMPFPPPSRVQLFLQPTPPLVMSVLEALPETGDLSTGYQSVNASPSFHTIPS